MVRSWLPLVITGCLWGCSTVTPPKAQQAEVLATDKASRESAAVLLVLQKQVRERDRRIAILESKLDALKAIDQDQEQRKRVIKVPSTLP